MRLFIAEVALILVCVTLLICLVSTGSLLGLTDILMMIWCSTMVLCCFAVYIGCMTLIKYVLEEK